jgi:hypothetical protein
MGQARRSSAPQGSDLRAKDLTTPDWRHSAAAKNTRGCLIVPNGPRRGGAALLLVSTRLFPKELFTVGATEDNNRPLGGANHVNKRHLLAARRANRRQFGRLLRHRTRTREQGAEFLFLQVALHAASSLGFEAVRWMLQSAPETGGPFPPTFARCRIRAARPGTCQIAGLCAWRSLPGLLPVISVKNWTGTTQK